MTTLIGKAIETAAADSMTAMRIAHAAEERTRLLKNADPSDRKRKEEWNKARQDVSKLAKRHAPVLVAHAIAVRDTVVKAESKGKLLARIARCVQFLKEDHSNEWHSPPCKTCPGEGGIRDAICTGKNIHVCDVCGSVNGDPGNKFLNPEGKGFETWLFRDPHGTIHDTSTGPMLMGVQSGVAFAYHPCLPCAAVFVAYVMAMYPDSEFGFRGHGPFETEFPVLDHAFKLARLGTVDTELLNRRDWIASDVNAFPL